MDTGWMGPAESAVHLEYRVYEQGALRMRLVYGLDSETNNNRKHWRARTRARFLKRRFPYSLSRLVLFTTVSNNSLRPPPPPPKGCVLLPFVLPGLHRSLVCRIDPQKLHPD